MTRQGIYAMRLALLSALLLLAGCGGFRQARQETAQEPPFVFVHPPLEARGGVLV